MHGLFWQTSGSPWGFSTQALGLGWVLVDWCVPTPLAGLSLRVAVWTGFSNCSMAGTSHEFVPIVKWLTVVLVINKYFTIKNCVFFVKLRIYYQTQFRHLTIGQSGQPSFVRAKLSKTQHNCHFKGLKNGAIWYKKWQKKVSRIPWRSGSVKNINLSRS